MDYYDFEIWIRAAAPGQSYIASVTNSPSGSASTPMEIDLASPEFKALLTEVIGLSGDGAKREKFGTLVFEGLFRGAVRDAWNESLGRVRAVPGRALRLRVWIDAPELGILPWELLHDGAEFLAISSTVLMSRFMPAGEPPAFVTPEKARILVVIQEPAQKPILPGVVDQLLRALDECGRFATPKVMRNSKLAEINTELLSGYEVLHYIGHGAADKLLIASDKEVAIRDGYEFAALLAGQQRLQLVVLNVCGSGATTTRGIFSGVGPLLSEKRVPAVIGMQYDEVWQKTAGEFNKSFYGALARSVPVDAAVNGARRGLFLEQGQGRHWSTPVLYMSTRTGRILEFADDPADAGVRAAELAREQAQREAAQRQMTVALGTVVAKTRELEARIRILNEVRALRERLNSLPTPPTTGLWRQVQQSNLTQLNVEVGKLPAADKANWVQSVARLAQELALNIANSNFGLADANRSALDLALGDAIVELEAANDSSIHECQTAAGNALALFQRE